MVMQDGQIVEFDTPPELLSNVDSYFYEMAKAAFLVNTNTNGDDLRRADI